MNRREFIRNSSMGAALMGVTPTFLSARTDCNTPTGMSALRPQVLAQCLIGVGVVAIGVGAYYVWIKAHRAACKAAEKKKKELEKALADDDDKKSASQEFAAWFVMGPAPQWEEDPNAPVVGVRYVVPPIGDRRLHVVSSLADPKNLVDADEFGALHGITMDAVDTFAVNGQPSKNAEPRITKAGGIISVNVEGSLNVLTSLQRSFDLRNWETLFNLNARAGTIVKTTDSSAQKAFFRAVVI